jgi:ATP synthase F1 gamma subunit
MKIVASTKLTRAQKAMTDSRRYGQTSNKVFEEAETKPLEEKKTLLVVASSDKGLCGGIHSGLSRATRRMLEEDPAIDIAIIGEKAKAQLGRSNGKNIVLSFAGIGKDVPTFADAQAIADQLALLPEDYASIKILYNKFINAQSYEPTTVEAYSEEAITQSANFAAFEIDDEVLANLREYALANSLYWALAEGHACEQSARRNAMDVSGRAFLNRRCDTDQVCAERLQERRRHDRQVHHPVQQNPTSRHYWRVGRNYYWCYCLGRHVGSFQEKKVVHTPNTRFSRRTRGLSKSTNHLSSLHISPVTGVRDVMLRSA